MNTIKTTFLLAGLTGLMLAVGFLFGGSEGAFVALILSAIMNFGSYWFSDKIVLALYGAKEVSKSKHPELYSLVGELTKKAALPMPKLYLVHLPTPNAFATGRNEKHAAVAVTDGLLKLLSRDELKGVLSHELAHIKNKDILIASIAATLAGAISYLAQMAYFASASASHSRGSDRDGGNGMGAIALLILTPIIATILHLAVSRSREYLADEVGAGIAKDPKGLALALGKLHVYSRAHPLVGEPKYEATSHLFIINPFKPSFLMSLFSTHPPIEERIRRLERMKI